jgi:hypothetical protein
VKFTNTENAYVTPPITSEFRKHLFSESRALFVDVNVFYLCSPHFFSEMGEICYIKSAQMLLNFQYLSENWRWGGRTFLMASNGVTFMRLPQDRKTI